MAPSPASAQQVDVLYDVLMEVAAHEVGPVKEIINHKISLLISLPLPEGSEAQISLFKSLIRLQDAHSSLSWHHQGLYERLDNLGAKMVRQLVSKGPNGALKLREDMEVMPSLPVIKARCSLDPSYHVLLNTRLRQMVDEVKDLLRQPLDSNTDERLVLLGRVAKFRNYYMQYHSIDDDLNKKIQKYAEVNGSVFGSASVDVTPVTTPAEVPLKLEVSSPSPKPLINIIKREESAPPPKPLATATIKEEEPSYQAPLASIKQERPSTQSPLQALFAARAAREEARQQIMRVTEREELRVKNEARKEAIANDPAKAEQAKYAKEMKAKLEKEAIEKQNVLASIEADKIARREKAEMIRLRRIAEQEEREETEKATQMKNNEVEAKLSEIDEEMEFGDEDEDEVEEEGEEGDEQEEAGDEQQDGEDEQQGAEDEEHEGGDEMEE